MSDYTELKGKCEEEGITVKEVPKERLKDFAAIHDKVAPVFGYPKLPIKTILIDKTLPSKTKLHTLRHEMIERKLMVKGKKYWPAHCISLVREKKPL